MINNFPEFYADCIWRGIKSRIKKEPSPKIQDSKLKPEEQDLLSTLSWNLESGIWNLESGIWNLESGIWNLESGIWNLETGEWNLENGI